MNMEYPFEVIRGWPNDGALDNVDYEVDATALASDTFAAGDVVMLNSSAKLVKTGATATNACGFIVRGPSDSASVGVSGNRPVVLWGNFIAKTQKFNTGSSYSPGTALTSKNGVLDVAGAGTPGTSFPDPVVGYVMDVVAAVGSEPAHLVIVVK